MNINPRIAPVIINRKNQDMPSNVELTEEQRQRILEIVNNNKKYVPTNRK